MTSRAERWRDARLALGVATALAVLMAVALRAGGSRYDAGNWRNVAENVVALHRACHRQLDSLDEKTRRTLGAEMVRRRTET